MPSLPPPSSLLLFLCSSFSLQVCKFHHVPPYFQHPCVLLFISMLSCSSILLQVLNLHRASLVVLLPMIPPPTIVPPTSYKFHLLQVWLLPVSSTLQSSFIFVIFLCLLLVLFFDCNLLVFFFLYLFNGFVFWLFCFLILFCCFPFSLQLYKLHPTLSFFQHIIVFRCINNMCKMSG